MEMIHQWDKLTDQERNDRNGLEDRLFKKTIVRPEYWADTIKDRPDLNFEPVFVTDESGQVIYLRPGRQGKRIWKFCLEGFERWQKDYLFEYESGLLGDIPIKNVPNYIQLDFKLEAEAHLIKDSLNASRLTCPFVVLNKLRINFRDKIDRQYYQDKGTPVEKIEVKGLDNFLKLEGKTAYGNYFDEPATIGEQASVYWRPNSNNLLYPLKGNYDYYWINTGAYNRETIDNSPFPFEEYNHFRINWDDFFSWIPPVEMRIYWQGKSIYSSVGSVFLNQLDAHLLYLKNDKSDMKLKFDHVWDCDTYYHENIIKQYENDRMQFVRLSYSYKIQRLVDEV
jgi:hypothetical protein